MTRYLLVVNFEGGVVESPMEEWKPEEVTAHLDYYRALHRELSRAASWSSPRCWPGRTWPRSSPPTAPPRRSSRTDRSRSSRNGSPATRSSTSSRRSARSRSPAKLSAVPGPGGVALAAADPGAPGHERLPPTSPRWRRSSSRRAASADAPPRVEDLLRELAPQVLGALVRRYGDFDAAEDAVQEALLAASVHWPRDGVPDSPRGWLLQTAERRLIDQWRSEPVPARTARASRSQQEATPADVPDRDDTLIRAVHVLPSGADAGVGDRSDAAGGRRADHGRDRERVPRRRGDDGAADQQGEAADQGLRRARSGCRRATSGRPGCARCCTCST